MAKGDFLGEFEQLVLLALLRLGEDAYGMAVRREIADRAGRDVAIGAVYATLDRLEQKGLVRSWTAAATDDRAGRPRRCFRITGEGGRALDRSQRALRQMLEGLPARWNPAR
ncbi:MAG: helix-turn-helix transcriptional regulator [Acidobacteriota bacterium]